MIKRLMAAAAVAALVGCGGDDDALQLAIAVLAATPAAENGVIDTAKAATVTNEARAADAVFPDDYCAIAFSDAPSSNGKVYQVLIYFREADETALFASVADLGAPWSVDLRNTTVTGIDGVKVDVMRRTIEFNGAKLTGNAPQAATLTGTISFPANPANNPNNPAHNGCGG